MSDETRRGGVFDASIDHEAAVAIGKLSPAVWEYIQKRHEAEVIVRLRAASVPLTMTAEMESALREQRLIIFKKIDGPIYTAEEKRDLIAAELDATRAALVARDHRIAELEAERETACRAQAASTYRACRKIVHGFTLDAHGNDCLIDEAALCNHLAEMAVQAEVGDVPLVTRWEERMEKAEEARDAVRSRLAELADAAETLLAAPQRVIDEGGIESMLTAQRELRLVIAAARKSAGGNDVPPWGALPSDATDPNRGRKCLRCGEPVRQGERWAHEECVTKGS